MIYLGLKMDLSLLVGFLIILVIGFMSGLLWLVLKGFIIIGKVLFFIVCFLFSGVFWIINRIRE